MVGAGTRVVGILLIFVGFLMVLFESRKHSSQVKLSAGILKCGSITRKPPDVWVVLHTSGDGRFNFDQER